MALQTGEGEGCLGALACWPCRAQSEDTCTHTYLCVSAPAYPCVNVLDPMGLHSDPVPAQTHRALQPPSGLRHTCYRSVPCTHTADLTLARNKAPLDSSPTESSRNVAFRDQATPRPPRTSSVAAPSFVLQ